jgi:hypothetical protein
MKFGKDVVHDNTFDRPPQRRSANVQMSHSDIAQDRSSPVTTQQPSSTPDDAIADTTVVSNLSRKDNTRISELSMVTGLSIVKRKMYEIDKQREIFNSMQRRMDDSTIRVMTSISKLTADILAVGVDMNKMSDKLEQKLNRIIDILETADTPVTTASPPRKVSRATNNSPVKLSSPVKETQCFLVTYCSSVLLARDS